jgi:peroxiredoxin Q/BCP
VENVEAFRELADKLSISFETTSTVSFQAVSQGDADKILALSKKLGLNFPILADHNHQLANQLGIVRNLGIAKIAKRETFLIDPQGTVVYHYSSVNTQTHAGQVLADIQKFSKK